MYNHDYLVELIEKGYECDYLDFKAIQYSKDRYSHLLKDIMAMANSMVDKNKYIIIGVKDKPNGDREILGIDDSAHIDSSELHQLISSNIEPFVNFNYFTFMYKGKKLAVLELYNNTNKPYMMKKKYKDLDAGYCMVRKGSQQAIAVRSDYDLFYQNKDKFEIIIMDNTLWATDDKNGCAKLMTSLRNLTNNPITIKFGRLVIKNMNNEVLTQHPLYGLNDYVGADFLLGLSPKSEKTGELLFGFTSTQSLQLGLDVDGYTDEEFIFELFLFDTVGNEYSVSVTNANVIAKGEFLWKVRARQIGQ
ncbi:helix-turn-helix domain-containing protein [Brevibacillus fulvus]|uniref:Schlafen AlbA-2 domain-containing protein n=1 Tax=Brevibacillus fulvus TaxID=1125967 RepID=A0A938XX69_9BACL|nr:ATP-binding protein [Brevibacillus fulvus]MBM7591847.1 hypothetical protein [Brevibacillus fulvus]